MLRKIVLMLAPYIRKGSPILALRCASHAASVLQFRYGSSTLATKSQRRHFVANDMTPSTSRQCGPDFGVCIPIYRDAQPYIQIHSYIYRYVNLFTDLIPAV